MQKPGIIIVDDHPLFRSGLKLSNGNELMEILNSIKPNLIIMDINMPEMNGIDATKKALLKYPDLNILVLSMYGEIEYYNTMIDMGIKGFMLKEADNDEFILAINKILSGGTYFSQELLLKIIRKNKFGSAIKLSEREKEILQLISQGLSNHEISHKLNISQRTVERHRTNLLEKTGSKNSVQLIIFAVRHNIINLN
jgi:DNA-binding NarL/FixJ family response regulator